MKKNGADYLYCDYLLVLGLNSMASGGATLNIPIAEARERGMKIVVVAPVFTVTTAKEDEWIPIKPCQSFSRSGIEWARG